VSEKELKSVNILLSLKRFIAESVSEFFSKSVNIWQSCKHERDCLMHFARLANTLLKDEESARNSHLPACNFAKYSPIKKNH